MTAQQLKELEKRLWEAADQLRASSKLTASEYSFPVLGLLFPYPKLQQLVVFTNALYCFTIFCIFTR